MFEALTSDRPYREALAVDVAREMLLEGRGSHFDPEVVDAFLSSEAIRQIIDRPTRMRTASIDEVTLDTARLRSARFGLPAPTPTRAARPAADASLTA